MRRHAQAKLHLFQRLLVASNYHRRDRWRGQMEAIGHTVKSGETLFDELHKSVMVQISRGRNDHVVGRKALAVKVEQLSLFERAHGFLGPQDRLAQRMVFPETLREDFMDKIIRIVLIHLNFFQDHTLFAENILGIESWIEYKIAQNVDGDRQVLIQHLDVEANGFFSGKGVHVAADGIHLAGDIARSARLGAFEHHVFGKMGDAIQLWRFIPRAGLHPYAYGNGADVRHLFTQHN